MKTTETKITSNSIAAGDKSAKIHIWNGSRTLWNRRSLMTESKVQFAETAKKSPSLCCAKCLSKLN